MPQWYESHFGKPKLILWHFVHPSNGARHGTWHWLGNRLAIEPWFLLVKTQNCWCCPDTSISMFFRTILSWIMRHRHLKAVSDPHLFLSVEADGDRLRTLSTVLKEHHPYKVETKGCTRGFMSPGGTVFCRLQGTFLLFCYVGEWVISSCVMICCNGRTQLRKGESDLIFLHLYIITCCQSLLSEPFAPITACQVMYR